MSSGVGMGLITRQIAKMYKFNNYQYSVVIGLLLSDAWIIYNKRSVNPRIGFKQKTNKKKSFAKFEYLFSVFTILSPFCNSVPALVTNIRNNKKNIALNFCTRSLPCIKDIHLLFYEDNKKKIPQDIYNLLDPIALTHWICGDGSVSKKGLLLCTDSYSIEDVVRLVNVLIIRYNLICTIRLHRENQYRIYISERSLNSLKKLVLPYMVNSMKYKICH